MRGLLCKMFGHMRRSGWWGDALYGKVLSGGRDDFGRTHYRVELKCDRCGEKYIAARFHGHQVQS